MERTLTINSLQKVGENIKLQGWVSNFRLMGSKLAFIDLRDRSGKIQCVIVRNDDNKDLPWEEISGITMESVVELEGLVKQRPEKQINADLATGAVEVEVFLFKMINKCGPLPIPVNTDGKEINEEARLEYRYLDLRRDRMHNIVTLRSKFTKAIRDEFFARDFTEVETPLLSASTKEGARDFVVPSRLHPGKFYALPQSPQQYKQLLMTAGVERYFQIAKCIRDEDLRADRGFEFTQVDVEMSFTNQEEIMSTIENIVKKAVKSVGGKMQLEMFPRFTYEEAISKYGADKFDLRTEEEKAQGVLAFAWVHRFPFFKSVDKEDVAEVRDGKSGWTFTHNPFSAPLDEHIEWHKNKENIGQIITQQYDLVCNGYEVGGGSVRAHDPEILRTTYKIMGYSDEEIERSIGHMLKAFALGTPPHGGIALGLDRLVMLLANEESLKETMSFPMTYNGRTSVMQGPGEISEEQKKELSLK